MTRGPSLQTEPLLHPSPEPFHGESDIVERLKDAGLFGRASWVEVEALCKESAAEIERLRRENALLRISAPVFKTGDRARHVSRQEDGTVTVLKNGDVQVLFDNLSSRGTPSIGVYDANWFKTYPSGLKNLTAESLLAAAWENAETIASNIKNRCLKESLNQDRPPVQRMASSAQAFTASEIATALRAAGKERE